MEKGDAIRRPYSVTDGPVNEAKDTRNGEQCLDLPTIPGHSENNDFYQRVRSNKSDVRLAAVVKQSTRIKTDRSSEQLKTEFRVSA